MNYHISMGKKTIKNFFRNSDENIEYVENLLKAIKKHEPHIPNGIATVENLVRPLNGVNSHVMISDLIINELQFCCLHI